MGWLKKQRLFVVQYATKRFPTWRVGLEIEQGVGWRTLFDRRKSADAKVKLLRSLYKENNKYGYKFRVKEVVVKD